MTHKWGTMATYPDLGDSQLSLQEEMPHGETPHLMRVYVPSANRPYPWSSGAHNLGFEIRGRRGLWPFWAKRPNFTQKWSLEKSYLRIARDMSLRLLHGCKPKLCFPFATSGGGLHEMGKGSVRAAIASERYLWDVEVKLHNMHMHDEVFITNNDEHVEEIAMKQ